MRDLLLASSLAILITAAAHGGDLPQGWGLAARYPGDRGLAKERSVLFTEDFERGEVVELEKTWNSVSNHAGRVLSFQQDGPRDATGERCLEMTATVPENEGGHLYKRLPREVDTAFARFYVKFPEEAGYIHHFVHLGGYRPATNWPQGGAGSKPRGDERMTVGIEPTGERGKRPPPGVWNLYPYWHEMKASAGNRYWGNSITPVEPATVPRDRWQCVELMLKANTPGQRDGELALWLDGKLTMHVRRGVPRGEWTGMGFRLRDEGEPFEGFRWRTDERLKINFFWLLHYVTEVNQQRNRQEKNAGVTVWFDNIVVSEEYVGPIKPRE